MKKHFTNLRIALVGFLVCLMSMSMMAQNVTLDFSVNDWGLATSSAEGGTAAQSFTNTDGYSVTLFATTKYYYYNNTYTDDNYYCLMLGKTNSTLTLPAFDFDVEKIEVVGTSNASASVKLNVLVGDVAVSTQTTGIKDTTQTFEIDPAYQAAGNIYVLKVQSNHNCQIAQIKVYAAATPEPPTPVIEPTWVSCDQVGIFNTQVVGLVPTCATVGDSTVYHFVYNEDFTQYPYQTPNLDWGADGNVIYVDVAVSRPSEEVTGVEVSFGPGTEHIVTFGDVLDPNNGTLGADRYAALRYFRVATVVGGQAVGNETDFHKTATYKWYTGEELVAIQKLHVVVDAAPVPDLPYDSIATLPYTYNFDEGTDPYFMINNGEAVNKWYVGQAQGFDNNKLYISNNGLTNKYDITKASNVMAYRTVMVPETGAILSFDYRVNGQANYDYLKVNLVKGETTTEIATLQGENDWASFSYDISGEMAGEVCIQFNWVNNATNGNQFPAAIDNISVIETPCSQPTALTATVDSTTAVITWVAAEGQTAWNFEYKLADHSEWYTVPATETTVTLNDLQGNSNYEMRVQAVCGENLSAWTTGSFAVDCQNGSISVVVEDVEIGTNGTTNSYLPFYGLWNYAYSQQIIDAEEINTTAGNIYSVSFNCSSAPASTSTGNIKIWMANTTKSVFDNNTDYIDPSTLTLVYEGPSSYTYHTGWNTFTFNTPFEYTGGNVVVAYYEGNGSYSSGSFYVHSTTGNKSISHYQDDQSAVSYTSPATATGTKYFAMYRNHMKLNMDVTVGSCDDVVACPDPSDLEVSDITPNSAVLSWTAGSADETAFILECQAEGATEWTSIDVNDTTYTLTGLAQLTNYSVKVKANCGENNWSEVITASFRTIGICPPVTDLETANVSNTTTLTWTAGGEETAWLVEFKPATAGDDAWTSIDVNLIPMTTFGGLQGNVDYDVRVKALCDPEDAENQSEWTSTTFHSGCAAFEVPFTESFAASTMPTCWENTEFHFSTSGDGYAYSYTNGAELISPAINIPAENPTYLSFEVRGSGSYTVLASYRGTRADRFAEIYSGTAPNQNTTVTIALDDLYKGRAVNFKVVNNSTSYQYFYHLTVNQCPFEATALNTSNVTGNTVDLAWEADEAAANFQVQYGEQGFAIGEGTSVDVNNANEITINELNYETTYDFYVRVVCEGDNGAWFGPVSATTAPACSDPEELSFEFVSAQLSWTAGEWGTPAQYNVRYKAENDAEYNYTSVIPVDMPGYTPFATISGLASNTTYEMGVQSVCGENMESNWVTLMVTTPCMPLTEIPYTQDFEGDVFPPECWSQQIIEGSEEWEQYTGQAYFTYDPDNKAMLITPSFDLSSSPSLILSFKHKQEAFYGSQDELRVYYRTSMNSNWVLMQAYTENITSMTQEEIAIPAEAMSSSCQFAFEATANDGYGIYVDDVTIKPAPTCGTPFISVNGLIATITPNEPGTPAGYELMIGEQTATVTETTVDLSTVFTLEGSTIYQVSVRAICGEEDNSEWSTPVSFTTPCLPIDLPYIEDFESYEVPTYYYREGVMPNCWTSNWTAVATSATSHYEPKVTSTTSYNPTGSQFLYFMAGGSSYSYYQNPTVVILPEFDTDLNQAMISFRARCNNSSYTTYGALSLGYVNANNEFTSLTTVACATSAGAEKQTILLDEYTIPTGSKLAFKADYTYSSAYSTFSVGIDDISVELIPSCGVPSISVSGTTATITPTISTPESYDLQIGNEIVTVISTTIDLMDVFTLELGESYEISVRANCSEEDKSEWSNPYTFKYEISYNIDEQSSITTCNATLYDDGGAEGDYSNSKDYTVTIYPENNNSLIHLQGEYNTENNWDWIYVYDGVGTSATQLAKVSNTGTLDFTSSDPTGALTVRFTSDGSTIRSGFAFSITCEVTPTCFAPAQPTVSEIGETSAVITWVDDNNQGLYALQYKAEGDANWTDVANIDTTYYLLNNLTASTEYTVKVKAICGTDDESDYSQSIAFRTNCIGGGNIEIAGTGSNQNYIPVGNFYNYSYTQQILTAEEIGATGTISSISFEYAYFTPTTSKNNVKIYMANTDKSEFASTSDWFAVTDMQLVYQGNLNCSEGWNEFALNNTFAYAGGNLAIIVEDNSGAYNGSGYVFATTTTSEYRALTWQQDGAPYAGQEGTRRLLHSNIRLTVCPEAIDLAVTGINTIADACDVEGAVTIGVKNMGYEGTVSTFEAYYQVNEETPVHETVTLATPIAFNEAATYTFSQLPAFATGENTLTAWVELTGDAVDANNTITSAPITVLAPIAVPYEEAFTGLTINHGWNPIDANNDGITMNLNNNINYTFNDEAAADDWMMSPCIEMAAGTYTIIYDYKANSSLTESFEVFYGNGAHIADMTNAVATHTFNNTTVETATTTITIPADGIYNFGFHATSLPGNLGFSIDNFKVYPVNDVIVTYNELGGTVIPNDTIAVNYGENLTLNLVPNPMYHVAGVWVDGVQVVPEDGTGANFMLYTLENVTEAHNVFVDFKLEFHIIKNVENYRADLYTDLGGAFVPAATDTTINPDPFTVNMMADPHYHLYSLEMSPMVPDNMVDVTAGVVDNGDGTYSYTIDTLVVANYYLLATFRRDTVDINYTVLTGKGYANDSQLLNTSDTYTTWVDYSVNNDVDTTVTFSAGDTYHIVDVIVNGESQGRIDNYTFEDITETQTVGIKYGYKIDAIVSNYNTYGDIAMDDPQGTIVPTVQYIPEFDPMTVTGTVAEHFHLYQLLVNGENRIDEVVFDADPHSYSFTMDSVDNNYTIEAVVKVDTFAITYDVVAGQGYADASGLLVAPATYSTIVNYADDWMSNIIPDRGFAIANVDLDGQNLYTANNNQFNYITTDHLFTVSFAANTYTVNTNAYGEGTVSDGITFTYDPANPVNYEFVATPAEGYYVSAVIINNEAQDLTDVEGAYTTTIEDVADNYTINTHFSIYTYTMTAEAGEGGVITPVGAQTVNYGTDMTYEINANEGWYIAQTVIDGVTTDYTQDDAVVSLNVPFNAINADHNVNVTFAQFMYTITATAGANGTVNDAEAVSANVAYGSNYTLTFTPAANYQVADVVVDGQSVGAVNSYELINITADHTVSVTFEAIMYTLTATSNIAECTITPATTTVQAGSDVAYTLSAANGYHLLNVMANGEEVTVTGNAFTIANVQSDYAIYANFVPDYVTVTVDQPDHATITPGTQTYAYGATPSYMIVPQVGYEVVSVTAGNAVINVTYNNGIGTFTLPALQQDITLTATTAVKTYTISVTQGANGTIAPATQNNVEYGDSRTFTITANDYYVIADVIVDGSSRGAISSYTFHNVTDNHTITAVFEANCNIPTNLVAMNIDTTSADLMWVGTAPSYEVRYKAAGAASYTTQTVTATTLSLTALTPNTLYEWGVRSICGSDLTSDWAVNAFTTKAVPADPGYGIADAELNSVKVYSYLNNVYIVNEDGVAISNVDIYDIYGKQVYTGKVLSSPEVITLSVANGNYVVRLATDNGIGVYKVAIVR